MAVTTERSRADSDPAVHGRVPRGGRCGPACAHLRDPLSREGAGRRSDRASVGNTAPSQGVELATMEALVRYWGTEYDLRRVEARLNACRSS